MKIKPSNSAPSGAKAIGRQIIFWATISISVLATTGLAEATDGSPSAIFNMEKTFQQCLRRTPPPSHPRSLWQQKNNFFSAKICLTIFRRQSAEPKPPTAHRASAAKNQLFPHQTAPRLQFSTASLHLRPFLQQRNSLTASICQCSSK